MDREMLTCPACNASQEPDSNYCDQCGECLVPPVPEKPQQTEAKPSFPIIGLLSLAGIVLIGGLSVGRFIAVTRASKPPLSEQEIDLAELAKLKSWNPFSARSAAKYYEQKLLAAGRSKH